MVAPVAFLLVKPTSATIQWNQGKDSSKGATPSKSVGKLW